MVRPLRGGGRGGGKGPTTKEKGTFIKTFFFICSCGKIKYTLLKTTCRNINISVLKCTHSMYKFLKTFALKYGSFSPKIVENFLLLSKSVSGYFKFLMATKPRGGGKGLSGLYTKKKTFFAASLINH